MLNLTGLLTAPFTWLNLLWMFVEVLVMLVIILIYVMAALYGERKILGHIQLRPGPNRTGPGGVLQPVADVIKLLFKEDVIPAEADVAVFKIAPVIAFVPSFMTFAVAPWAPNVLFTDLNVGVLYFTAVTGITTIGIVSGGWSSGSKYPLLGGMRGAAQLISYELPLVMSILGVVLMAGTANMAGIVEAQQKWWFFFPQILGFVAFFISVSAEMNRTPFDLPEGESEIVAGYHTEYSGFRMALWMLGEYTYIFADGLLCATLFFGGWHGPWLPGWLWLLIKAMIFVFLAIWTRGTLPRMRSDTLMVFAWKFLLPLAMANLIITALVKAAIAGWF
ncbi:MAG: NADH-quinone oxidoreductase subunit NuoH [Firmicutes bacterium]|nr:NADH-quinone oxidoreductase subunit NuoH [Bacillota bacterium]